ncbi:MAG: DEAD/DEAH box helicase, partial [bacterium]|nr:DEAD/DEAH box helicase [bacterium]
MINIEKYLSPAAITQIKNEIMDIDGAEVFFIGKTNDDLIVEQVQVVARGNEFMVPIVEEAANRSDVIIHNHPSGTIQPSSADLMVSQQLSKIGVASYIINNSVDQLFVIIEPFPKQGELRLDIPRISQSLQPTGVVAKYLKNYEHRPQQVEMIKQIAVAFNDKKIAIIEAGTGVGKSLAYLIPAIYWSVQNKQRVVVSTRTINLQQQLIQKDIPFLKRILDIDFQAELVKGRSNYVCL